MFEKAPVVSKPKEHLNPGIKPIYVCLMGDPIGEKNEEMNLLIQKMRMQIREIEKQMDPSRAHDVEYGGDEDSLQRRNFLQTKRSQCVISPIDEKDKFSTGFNMCTSLIVTGIDKITGKNISFMSHQNPRFFLYSQEDAFTSAINDRLSEIRDRCLRGTIDAVLIGGDYDKTEAKDYKRSLILTSKLVEKRLGFEPKLASGPKKAYVISDGVYYKTEDRQAYLIREKINPDAGDFVASDINKVEHNW